MLEKIVKTSHFWYSFLLNIHLIVVKKWYTLIYNSCQWQQRYILPVIDNKSYMGGGGGGG